jgi:acetyl-CoA synthetase
MIKAESLASRINDCECKLIITMNQAFRGGKLINLKETVDLAVEKCPTIQNVLVFKRTENDFKINNEKDILIDNILNNYSTECKPEIMDSEDPLFILYTSGSTGKPKGIVHSNAGYLLHVSLSFQLIFNYKQNDVFGCLADIGWITGHSYVVYAPLSNGGTTVLFESTPTYPNPGRYWNTVERLKINQLYIAPTSLRVLNKYGDDWVNKYDRSSLKVLGSVGEPINHEAWMWYHKVIGSSKCNIADTWWQTETGGISICPLPSDDNKFKPTFAMRPFFGIEPCLLDDKGNELDMNNENKGVLCLKQPWPGMGRTINGDHERYLETYFRPYPGYYFTGDGANTDSDGHIQITGRVDDVMNVSGHRIGTAEVEDSLQEHLFVAESAVVGFPHEMLGEGIYAFVVLKENNNVKSDNEIIKELKILVKNKISGYAVPQKFLIIKNLPKTRSGKIMRRILRKIASNNLNDFGDITTLSEPYVVDEIVQKHVKINN